MRRIILALTLAMAFSHAICGGYKNTRNDAPPEPSTEISSKQEESMKIRLKVDDPLVTATLIDSKTTRDFISLLPLTLTINDLFRREKFAHLPRAI
jgi:hypothetical protein